jgi:hypothetical protein
MVCLSVSSSFRLQVVSTSVQDKMNRDILLCDQFFKLPRVGRTRLLDSEFNMC